MNFSIKKKELLLLLLLLLTGVGFIILFFYDLNQKIDIGDREIIGTIEFKNNIVQRKLEGHMVWETIKKNSELTNRDTIRSDNQSDAVIRLNDGTVISMDENSMFYLDISGKDPTLDLTSGNINVKKSSSSSESLKIKAQDSIVSLQGGELNLNQKQDGSLTMHVEDGEASITQDGVLQKVESGNFAKIDGGKIQIKKIPFQLQNPGNNKIIITKKDSESVEFQWKPVEAYTKHSLQISRSSTFDSFVSKIDYPKQTEKISLPLGSYYWRVTSDNGSSPVYRFQVFRESNVSSKLPTDNVVVSYVEKLPSINFQWNDDPLAKDYVLEISEVKKFEKISTAQKTTTNSMSVDTLDQGEYYWRVKTNPVSDDLPLNVTPTKTFRVQKTTEFLVPEPVRPVNTVYEEEDFKKTGLFAWDSSNELVEYDLQVSEDYSFSKFVINTRLRQNFWKPSNWKGKGKYFWRVRGIAASGKNSAFSSVVSFEIMDKSSYDSYLSSKGKPKSETDKPEEDEESSVNNKVLVSPLNASIDLSGKSSILFEWKRHKDIKEEYLFSLFKDDGKYKRPIQQVKTRGLKYEFKDFTALDEGKYLWEISVLLKGKSIHKESSGFNTTINKLKQVKPQDIQIISPQILYKNAPE